MAEPVYRIAKWGTVFEKSENRKQVRALSWISFPVDLGSNGFMSLLEMFADDAPTIYGAWAALVCVAAACPERGTLANSNGSPMTLARIALKAKMPLGVMERLFAWATTKDVAWIEVADTPGESPSNPPENPRPHEHDTTRPDPTLPDTTGTERASVRPWSAGEKVVLDDAGWVALAALRQRIARVVSGNPNVRGRDLPSKDWRLCCVASAIAEHRLGLDWLDGILGSITERKNPPENRWGHFRGCLTKAAKRLGHEFRELETLVVLPLRSKPIEKSPA